MCGRVLTVYYDSVKKSHNGIELPRFKVHGKLVKVSQFYFTCETTSVI